MLPAHSRCVFAVLFFATVLANVFTVGAVDSDVPDGGRRDYCHHFPHAKPCRYVATYGAPVPSPPAATAATEKHETRATDPGALVALALNSVVGVLLDEVPQNDRTRVANLYINKPSSWWVTRARSQALLTAYRLVFRPYWYNWSDNGTASKYQLLPTYDQLIVVLDKGGPRRNTVNSHDYVTWQYTIGGIMLTDYASPGISEPHLDHVGGTWNEPFNLPVDPENIIQRSGYGCIDESEWPPNAVDPEQVSYFYDSTCQVEDPQDPSTIGCQQCHCQYTATQDCVHALRQNIGETGNVQVSFRRIAWNATLASQWRLGAPGTTLGADLVQYSSDLRDTRIVYQYLTSSSCEYGEGCLSGTGWRRLLYFDSTDYNNGTVPMEIGPIGYFYDDEGDPLPIADHNLYEWSTCHEHYHFMHYGTFKFVSKANQQSVGSKRGFCIQAVWRQSNAEWVPTWAPYFTCHFQGVPPGWSDEYQAGIPCQWIDISQFNTASGPINGTLTAHVNPDGLLCEGTLNLNATTGDYIWVPTNFHASDGGQISKQSCNTVPNADANNGGSANVTLPPPGQGQVTSTCVRGLGQSVGPKRDCELNLLGAQLRTCTPGATQTIHCSLSGGSTVHNQFVRVCESSRGLNQAIPCRYLENYANVVLPPGQNTAVTFTCPSARDSVETGGVYSLYYGALINEDADVAPTCV